MTRSGDLPTAPRPRHLPWLLPAATDVIGLLVAQGDVTLSGTDALVRWTQGDPGAADELRHREHDADAARRRVVAAVRRAFTTPIEPEDLFELSERMDEVINQAKDLVREAEVLALSPDEPMAEMCRLLHEGVGELVAAFPSLAKDPDAATEHADRAIHAQRGIERVYRRAMSALLEATELREAMGRRELYRRVSRIGDALVHVAERVWYAVVKHA